MRTTHILVPAIAATALALSACGDAAEPVTASAPTAETTVETETTPEETSSEESTEETSSEEESTEETTTEEATDEATSQGAEPSTEEATSAEESSEAIGPLATYEGQPGDVVTTENFDNTAGGDLWLAEANAAMRDVGLQTGFTFTGEQPLEFQVQYVDEAIEQGRGETIAMENPEILQVMVRGLRYPEPGEDVVTTVAGGEDIYIDPMFEGQMVIYIGVEEQYPFSIEVHETADGYVLNVLV